MKEFVYRILELDKYEYGIIVNVLNDARNNLIKKSKSTEYIDELLLKILDAPEKKKVLKLARKEL